MLTGFIKKLSPNRGYGFISPLSGESSDVFFNESALEDQDISMWNTGDEVRFEARKGTKGLRATRVERTAKTLLIKRDKEQKHNKEKCSYCLRTIEIVTKDILHESIPDDALVRHCCWSRICRAKTYSNVDPEIWSNICRRRGYMLARKNPRGF